MSRLPTPGSARQQSWPFPTGFRWGTASASYQIEGAIDEGGRGRSIWDTFSAVPGAVLGGDTGAVACDHYHRFRDDIALMADLGLDTYRLSLAWPRIMPDGRTPNPGGIAFYREVMETLWAYNIEPWVTLYHWDLPQALEDDGGWLNRDTASLFVDYATYTYRELGDLAPNWTTMNEPWCSAFLGYTAGHHAPGHRWGVAGQVAGHHLLLAHGDAVTALRAEDGDAQLGITLNFSPCAPDNPQDPRDVAAARKIDGRFNRWFMDPIFTGAYPEDVLKETAHLRWGGRGFDDFIHPGDLERINTSIDVLGVNYYKVENCAGRPDPHPADHGVRQPQRQTSSPWLACEEVTFPATGAGVTDIGWEIDASGLATLLCRLDRDYDLPPVYITENGAAFHDAPDSFDRIRDRRRISYVHDHLVALHHAIESGVDVRGYFYWSLLDNFEWAFGYSQRFGMVYVDYTTQRRIPKESAGWFREVIAANAVSDVWDPEGFISE